MELSPIWTTQKSSHSRCWPSTNVPNAKGLSQAPTMLSSLQTWTRKSNAEIANTNRLPDVGPANASVSGIYVTHTPKLLLVSSTLLPKLHATTNTRTSTNTISAKIHLAKRSHLNACAKKTPNIKHARLGCYKAWMIMLLSFLEFQSNKS